MRWRVRLGVRLPIFKNAGVNVFYCTKAYKQKLDDAVMNLKIVLDAIPDARRNNASGFIVYETEEVKE